MHGPAIHNIASFDRFDRPAVGSTPGVLLALLACLPIAGTLLVAQILPQLEAAFPGTANVRLLVSVALTIPALSIAICSWGLGWLADRVGSRRLLIGALLVYALLGLAPLVLDSLMAIIVTRAGMGIAEGIIMTCSTALIGDMYADARRERMLSLQTACASIAAVLFAVIGGMLGDLGWRAPFAVYGIALLALPCVILLVPGNGDVIARPASTGVADTREGFAFGPLAVICAATVILSLTFYVAQIQLPYLLNALGAVAPSTVGLVSALTNMAVVVGTLCFAHFRNRPLRSRSLGCFALLAAGLALAGSAHDYALLVAGLVVAGFAGGIALPTFLNGAMSLLPPSRRAQGAGMWQSSFWAGQFFSPILVIALSQASGSLHAAVMLCAAAALLLGSLVSLIIRGAARQWHER